ncbi:MAG: DALR domain-containing protein [Acidimicrobiales bacterium]
MMDDDLDTPGAVDQMFRLVRETNSALDAGNDDAAATAAAGALLIADTLGLVINTGGADVPPEVQALAEERQAARAAKDFARSDAIRDQLAGDGWIIEDSPDGPIVRPA